MFREAFGDLKIDIERIFVDGDICVAHCRVRGRHVGRALGGEPTRQPVDFQGITITRSKNGMLVEGWNVFDFLTMYQQIGWVPNPIAPHVDNVPRATCHVHVHVPRATCTCKVF